MIALTKFSFSDSTALHPTPTTNFGGNQAQGTKPDYQRYYYNGQQADRHIVALYYQQKIPENASPHDMPIT